MEKNKIQQIYSVPFRVRSYEVDKSGKTNLASICNYFQEIAGIHAHHLTFDISQLNEKGLTWVLYKMHVIAKQFPSRWDDINVTTWPSSGDGIRAFRDYELTSENGETLAKAVSQWMVLDTETKRPVRMPSEVMELGLVDRPHAIEPDKIPIKPQPSVNPEFITTVGLNDLDMNHHVNNVRYIEWMTGYISEEKMGHKRCMEIEIQFISEALHGDKIFQVWEIVSNKEKISIHHTLYSGDDLKPIAAGVSLWNPNLS